MSFERSSDITGLFSPGCINKSEGKSDFVVSSKTIILSQWCTCGVMINLNLLLPVFKISLSQNEIWSTGTSCQPVRFNFEDKSLHTSFASAESRNAIPPHSSLSKCKNDTSPNFCKGMTYFTFSSIFLY